MEEIWRPVVGFEGLYEASDSGKIRSIDRAVKGCYGTVQIKKGKILTPSKRKKGLDYECVTLYKEDFKRIFFVHTLIAQTFPEICGEMFEGCVINHKDENPANNVATNLEVCTVAYNNGYGTHPQKCALSKSRAVIQLTLDGQFVKKWNSATEARKGTGISDVCIGYCCKGHPKHATAGGFRWEYA